MEDLGHPVGVRLFELTVFRERLRRDTKLLNMIQFIHSTLWKVIFGRSADSIERSTSDEDSYMIADKLPLASRFISVPADMGNFSVSAFTAGIIKGVLEASGFPAKVTAEEAQGRTEFWMKFDPVVLEREKRPSK